MQGHCNNVAFSGNVLLIWPLCSPFVSLTLVTNVSLITNDMLLICPFLTN